MKLVDISGLHATSKTVALLWLDGFQQACSLHKCLFYFVHDNEIWVKTLQCFVLNGLVFLGSIAAFQYGVAPALEWLLAHSWGGTRLTAALQAAFALAYHALWLLPAYGASLVVNSMWYTSIARKTVEVNLVQRQGRPAGSPAPRRQAAPLSSTIGQEVYRVVLCTVFLVQAAAVGFIPIIGRAVEMALLSWLYALYCFDYKWALMSHPLQARIAFFERHWAFFGGFGSVCALASVALPFFVGAAIMAVLFPLFIIIACDVSPEQRAKQLLETRDVVAARQPGSLRIFWLSELVTAFLFRNVRSALQLLHLVGVR